MAQRLNQATRNYIVDCGDFFSAAEIRELIAWAEGLTEAQAAERNRVSIHTVHSHRQALRTKTGVNSGIGVIAYCLMVGHIRPLNDNALTSNVIMQALRAPQSCVIQQGGRYGAH
jgi:DNA-binding CsgD family transcriptional regulator